MTDDSVPLTMIPHIGLTLVPGVLDRADDSVKLPEPVVLLSPAIPAAKEKVAPPPRLAAWTAVNFVNCARDAVMDNERYAHSFPRNATMAAAKEVAGVRWPLDWGDHVISTIGGTLPDDSVRLEAIPRPGLPLNLEIIDRRVRVDLATSALPPAALHTTLTDLLPEQVRGKRAK